jgi:hypothetical protein
MEQGYPPLISRARKGVENDVPSPFLPRACARGYDQITN